jgi:hypothetical protein
LAGAGAVSFSLALTGVAHFWFALSADIVHMFLPRVFWLDSAAGNTGVIQAMIADRVTALKSGR